MKRRSGTGRVACRSDRFLPAAAVASGAIVIIALLSGTLGAQAPAPDPLFQAMHDELERARKLTLSNLDTPYFAEYLIDESDNFDISATLGGLLSRRRDRFRAPEANIRVGDY